LLLKRALPYSVCERSIAVLKAKSPEKPLWMEADPVVLRMSTSVPGVLFTPVTAHLLCSGAHPAAIRLLADEDIMEVGMLLAFTR
jgi:hypothetical protein